MTTGGCAGSLESTEMLPFAIPDALGANCAADPDQPEIRIGFPLLIAIVGSL